MNKEAAKKLLEIQSQKLQTGGEIHRMLAGIALDETEDKSIRVEAGKAWLEHQRGYKDEDFQTLMDAIAALESRS